MPEQFPLVGRTLSHYRVLAHLGGGGMGVVYKAEDSRLKRFVALKFLPSELTRDPEARERFVQEAQAASALDHPNICTVYEIDSADEQLFIAMAYCDGETLKKRLQRGPLSVADALDIAVQTARGLEKAHHAGIVHRDIKPANLMITADGLVKIVDFGIAKLTDRTGLTRTGTTIGTITYMAPEQVLGSTVDHRADLWAVGVVLYEMLTGAAPFTGDHDVAVLNNIVNQEPAPLRSHRPEVPADVERVVTRALVKRPEARYASAADLARELAACHTGLLRSAAAITAATPRPRVGRRSIIAAAIAAAVLIGVPGAWIVKRNADLRRAEASLAEITSLADRDDYPGAVARAHDVASLIPDDPRLAALWDRIAVLREIDTDPPGADVYIKSYDATAGAWEHLGRTPLSAVRLPYGVFRWKIEHDGYDPREFILANQFIPAAGQTFPLVARGHAPKDMILIPAGDLALTLPGYNEYARVRSDEFWFDRHEVTNAEFKAFVDAGGYTTREYWKHDFLKDGRRLSWEEAMAELRDRTGRPGPATWEVGTYPEGQDVHPVSGVSWYEAAAFAEFSGKSLPTVYHWLRAAGIGLAGYITPLSNVQGKGPAAVGSSPGITPLGAIDMAGNVKEWCWNEVAGERSRYILGGSWSEPDYMFISADARQPFDRSETNGFRLLKSIDGTPPPAPLTRPLETPTRDYGKEKPVSEDVFKAFKDLYSYDQIALQAVEESTEDAGQWISEKVSYRAAYGNERIPAFLFLPKNVKPPYQTLVYFPNATATTTPSSNTLRNIGIIDFLMLSGRAVLYPIYKGTYERNSDQRSIWPEANQRYRDWMLEVVADARRSVDYLESRPDIRHDQIAFFGQSWGAQVGSLILAVEPRLKAAVFLSGGFPMAPSPPPVDPFHFAPRISVPVLMLNGDIDYITPVSTSQLPLYSNLGTTKKRHRIFPGGHFAFWTNSRSQIVKESLDWLDAYVGPVR